MRGPTARFTLAGPGLIAPAILLAFALGLGAAGLGRDDLKLALALCLLPLGPVLILYHQAAAVAALAALPIEIDVAGAALGGLRVALSDLLLVAAFAGLVLRLWADPTLRRRLAVLRPMVPLLAAYAAAAVIVTAANPGLKSIVNLVQRVEVVIVPLFIGALLLTARNARRGLALFVTAALVLGMAWLVLDSSGGSVFGVQKNPAAQYVVDAALITLAVFTDKRLRFVVFPLLIIGVYATASRGALLGLLVGLFLYFFLRSRNPVQVVVRALPVALLLFGVYSALPESEQARIMGETESTEFNDSVRRAYIEDAWLIIGENPIVGVGIGNYLSGDPLDRTLTNDPHNILLLEAAEGGAVLITGFLVLQMGALVIVYRRRRDSPWALAAICVQVSILVHALVDVYWVRGTPVIGWLLIGLALAHHQRVRTGNDGGDDAEVEPPVSPSGRELVR